MRKQPANHDQHENDNDWPEPPVVVARQARSGQPVFVRLHEEAPKREADAQRNLNWDLSILSALILDSRVDRGTLSLAAAPEGPSTRPLVMASAASMISRSSGCSSHSTDVDA
jgi:hypothetical protein